MKVNRSTGEMTALVGLCLPVATYIPWVNDLLVEPATKITGWYPHIGGYWLSVRAYARPLLLSSQLSVSYTCYGLCSKSYRYISPIIKIKSFGARHGLEVSSADPCCSSYIQLEQSCLCSYCLISRVYYS
jgi:hypothetical protein